MIRQKILVDPLSTTSLRVVPKFGDVDLATATAFVVKWGREFYLVTNWHVVAGRDPDTHECLDRKNLSIPNKIVVNFHAAGRLGAWITRDIPLFGYDDEPLWLEHPLGSSIDVVVIKIENADGLALYSLDLSLADVDVVPFPAMSISVIGYPLGLTAGESWPIWKTGHIASDPDIDFSPGRPAFLIDATTKSGMSGSPVIIRLSSWTTRNGDQVIGGGIVTKFMGVYAGRIHHSSEIGRVWRPFVLWEIFQRKLLFDARTGRTSPGRISPCPCNRGRRFKECCGRIDI